LAPGTLQQRTRRTALLIQQRLQQVRRINLVVILAHGQGLRVSERVLQRIG
jgi:hypothetical protein